MAFRDKITSLFAPRRATPPLADAPQACEPAPAAAPEPPPAQTAAVEPLDRERHELIADFHEGVEQVGSLLTRLDRHLDASATVLDTLRETQQALPELLRRQHDLAGSVGWIQMAGSSASSPTASVATAGLIGMIRVASPALAAIEEQNRTAMPTWTVYRLMWHVS